jgi:hypothetical protein
MNAISLECQDTVLTKQIQGVVGKTFRFYCNKGCTKDSGFLFGTQIYHELSSICLSAIHDGKFEAEKGGEF